MNTHSKGQCKQQTTIIIIGSFYAQPQRHFQAIVATTTDCILHSSSSSSLLFYFSRWNIKHSNCTLLMGSRSNFILCMVRIIQICSVHKATMIYEESTFGADPRAKLYKRQVKKCRTKKSLFFKYWHRHTYSWAVASDCHWF